MKHWCLVLLSILLAAPAAAADFPPITDQERALTAVPGEPNAAAVVLFKKGEYLMAGYGLQSGNWTSTLRLQVRLKILTEEGRSNGEIAIGHGRGLRLKGFKARTVLPDGQVIPVPAEARFVRKVSRSRKLSTTAVAFPSVQVGAILDYQYELVFDSAFLLQPWYFSEEVPVLYSEVVFKTPPNLVAQAWSRAPMRVKIESETEKSSSGYILRARAKDIPSVPDDPYGPSYYDLASQMLLVPTAYASPYYPLLESWPQVNKMLAEDYSQVRRRDGGLAKRAREIAGSGVPRQQAEALYRFVRDQIETEDIDGVDVYADSSLAEVLSGRRGDYAEKALLLQAMLQAVKIDSRLVWAADRRNGAIDPQLPSPRWFDRVLVLLEMDGQRVFLDPTDRALGFGQLRAVYEGMPAMIHDPKKPEGIVLPETPFTDNLRRAELDLALDGEGRLAGTGTLRLTGHEAWEKIDWQEDEAATVKAWTDWLAESFREFQISDVKAVESPEERRVTLTWSMAQREEEVLGDESTFVPSAPVGPLAQPFVQPASSRRTGVVFDYPKREEVELRLRWPEGWKVEGSPASLRTANLAGTLSADTEVQEAERTLVYRRRVDLTRRELSTSQEYEAVRSLFAAVEKSDAQPVLLVRR